MNKCKICKSISEVYIDCCSICLCLVYEGLMIDDSKIEDKLRAIAMLELLTRLELWAKTKNRIVCVSGTFVI